MLLSHVASSSKGTALQLLLKKNYCHALSPLSCITEKLEAKDFLQKTNFYEPIKRPLHVTAVKRDLESGLRALGCGIAATGVMGSGIGIGIIFGNLLSSVARNPSVANKIFGNAIMGAAFCESLALFALAVAFMILP